jgi:hypothetical protein
MRSLLPATAVCFALCSLAGPTGIAQTTQSGNSAASAGATTPSAPGTAGTTHPADGDAAAKHAKRTACLKNAKAKKLVGAQKTAFIKECVAAP